ncbi:LysR substrate-binding domain-containing protein [Acidisoma silvae]|uniref:LysR substrate-binding domain-containing protein n=1 Tax=Acidisoma silvae TaxID=2802396 RepID=UPI0038732DE7
MQGKKRGAQRDIASSCDRDRNRKLCGFGLIQVPRYRCAQEIAEGTLVELMPDYPPAVTSISVLYPRIRQLSPRERVFLDWPVDTISLKI